MKLEDIKNPEFLKDLNYKDLDVLADQIRKSIIYTLSEKGGHLSSNLGVVELTIALHRCFGNQDKILFDVGHQTYTHKILTGRYEGFTKSLRDFNGISGYQKRNESAYDCFEAGHSSTSISAACGFAVANRINGLKGQVIAVVGDGAISSGMSLEALNNLGSMKEKVIIVLNDNEMAISKSVGGMAQAFSRIKTSTTYAKTRSVVRSISYKIPLGRYVYSFFRHIKNAVKRFFVPTSIFENFNLRYVGPIDGHNIKKMEKMFNYAKKYDSSIVIHVITKKGKGYTYAEDDECGTWHGVPKFEVETGCHAQNGVKTWSEVCADIVYNKMKDDKSIVTITPAMIEGSKLSKIAADFPSQFYDVGICEEHAFTFAAGLALNDIKPYISIYSTFMQRSYDQILHDLSRMQLGTVIGVDRCGLVGKDGETHQGSFDVSFVRTIPNTIIAMPKDVSDAQNLYNLAFESKKLFFIRFPRENIVDVPRTKQDIKIGQWDYVYENKKNKSVLIVTGPHFELVKKHFVDLPQIDLVYARFYHPIDTTLLAKLAESKRKIFIYDIYSDENGLYTPVCAYLLEKNTQAQVYGYSLPNTFIKQGEISEQLQSIKLDMVSVKAKIKSLL